MIGRETAYTTVMMSAITFPGEYCYTIPSRSYFFGTLFAPVTAFASASVKKAALSVKGALSRTILLVRDLSR